MELNLLKSRNNEKDVWSKNICKYWVIEFYGVSTRRELFYT